MLCFIVLSFIIVVVLITLAKWHKSRRIQELTEYITDEYAYTCRLKPAYRMMTERVAKRSWISEAFENTKKKEYHRQNKNAHTHVRCSSVIFIAVFRQIMIISSQ